MIFLIYNDDAADKLLESLCQDCPDSIRECLTSCARVGDICVLVPAYGESQGCSFALVSLRQAAKLQRRGLLSSSLRLPPSFCGRLCLRPWPAHGLRGLGRHDAARGNWRHSFDRRQVSD